MTFTFQVADSAFEATNPASVSRSFIRSIKEAGTDTWNSERHTLPTLACDVARSGYLWDCRRGIYVFFDRNEPEGVTDQSWRVVRIGTHSVKAGGSKTTLWDRLRQHKGNDKNGGGNHRGSIFRLLVGDAMIEKEAFRDQFPEWGKKGSAPAEVRRSELILEQKVSDYIRRLPFLVIRVDPAENGPEHRSYLEQNLIAYFSNINGATKAAPSDWLGRCSTRADVRESGLWNNDHVRETYDAAFLDMLEKYASTL